MKKISLISILLLTTTLLSKEIYIKVYIEPTDQERNTLKNMSKDFLVHTKFIKSDNNETTAYLGPLQTVSHAREIQNKIRKIPTKIVSLENKNQKIKKNQLETIFTMSETQPYFKKQKNQYFFNASTGATQTDLIKKDGSSLTIAAGYKANDFITSLNYQTYSVKNDKATNYLLSTKYNLYENNFLNLLAGANIGFSQLKWGETIPAQSPPTTSTFTYGATVELLFPIIDHTNLFINYTKQFSQHKARVFVTNELFEHNNADFINFGIQLYIPN